VISDTFLGPVTRLKVTFGEGEMTADVSASRADSYPVGTRVGVSFPSASARLLSL
jgi:TOBE domain